VAGDGAQLPKVAVQKAEKLYHSNFGLPRKVASSDEGVHAVLMSGIRLEKPRKVQKVKVKQKSTVRKTKGHGGRKRKQLRGGKKRK
jgi:hypothetical protein